MEVLDAGSIIKKISTYLTPLSDNIQEICKNRSIAYMDALKVGTTWAVKMWDSTAKLQTGLLTGNLNSLGNYDECIKITNIHDSIGLFNGQHCLATFEFKNISAADAMGDVLKEVMNEEKDINIGLGSILSKGLHWGFCIPSSCSYKDLQQSLSDYISNASGIDVSISKADCHDTQKTILSAAEIVCLWFIGFYFLLTFLSTIYEGIKNYLSNKYQIPAQMNEVLRTLYEHRTSRDNPDSNIRISVYDEPGTSGTNNKVSSESSVYASSPLSISKKIVGSSAGSQNNSCSKQMKPVQERVSTSSLESSPEAHCSKQNEKHCPSSGSKSLKGNTPSTMAKVDLQKHPGILPKLKSIPEKHNAQINPNPSTRHNTELESKLTYDAESQSGSLSVLNVIEAYLSPEGKFPHLGNLSLQEIEDGFDGSFETTTENGGSEENVHAQENVGAENAGTENAVQEENGEAEGGNDGSEEEIHLIAPDDTSPLPELNDSGDILETFSLISNWNRLFSFADSPAMLQSLNGLKFYSICWVLLGHSCFIMESLPALNYVSVKHFTYQWTAIVIMNASLAVDTFIVITGVLISYHFLKDMRKRGIYNRGSNRIASTGITKHFLFMYLPIYYFHRYVRLTPALLMVVLFQLSIYKYFGSGPLWDSGYGHLHDACRRNWWATLTYIENYVAGDRFCLPQSWYLMVDMQLYLLSPVIMVLLMAWSTQRSLFTIIILTSLGIMCSFFVNYLLEIPAGISIGDLTNWSLTNRFDYQAAYTRFGPWMIGIGVGYLLHYYREHGRFVFTIKWWARVLCWGMAIAALLFPLFGMQPFRKHRQKHNNVLYSAMFNSLYHSIWALGIGWIIIACECNYGGFIQSILSLKIFQPLSRLTYGIFLVHIPLMTIRALCTRVPIYVDGFHVISSFLGDLVLSSMFAVILNLAVEMPIIRLYKLITFNMKNPVRLMSTAAVKHAERQASHQLHKSVASHQLHKSVEVNPKNTPEVAS